MCALWIGVGAALRSGGGAGRVPRLHVGRPGAPRLLTTSADGRVYPVLLLHEDCVASMLAC